MSLHRELKLVFTQHLAFITLHDGSYNWLQHWLFQINVTSKRLLYPYFLLLLLLAIWLFPKVQRTICDCSSRLKSTSLAVSPWKKKKIQGEKEGLHSSLLKFQDLLSHCTIFHLLASLVSLLLTDLCFYKYSRK